MKIGIIGESSFSETFKNILSKKYVIIQEDTLKTIYHSDVIFFFDENKITTDSLMDTTNINQVVHDFGYSFENEVSVTGKVLVITCTLNPTDFSKIDEVLNPIHVEVVYCPLRDVEQNNFLIGTFNDTTYNKIVEILSSLESSNKSYIQLKPTLVEWINLFSSFKKKMNDWILKSFKQILQNDNSLEYEKPLLKLLNIESSNMSPKTSDETTVFSHFLEIYNIPANIPKNLQQLDDEHITFIIQNYLKLNSDKKTPFILDSISNSSDFSLNLDKLKVLSVLIKNGYLINIVESQEFLSNKKLISELIHDFGNQIKFYKSGTQVYGIKIHL